MQGSKNHLLRWAFRSLSFAYYDIRASPPTVGIPNKLHLSTIADRQNRAGGRRYSDRCLNNITFHSEAIIRCKELWILILRDFRFTLIIFFLANEESVLSDRGPWGLIRLDEGRIPAGQHQ